jgi:Rrf2 family protein
MKLSKRGEYGLRVLLDLAMAAELELALVPLSALAEAQAIPANFLEHILADLRQAGFVTATRGKYGGYSLAKPASEIRLGDLVRCLDGPLAPIRCASVTAYERCSCPDEKHCGLRLAMQEVRNAVSGVLDGWTLSALATQTLSGLRADGCLPPLIAKIRHWSLASRPRAAALKPAPLEEPEFSI